MVKLFSVKEMLALEKEANENGLTYEMMMQNAGQGIAEEVNNSYRNLPIKSVVALVGSGNNGGDALVALSHLSQLQWNTTAYIVRKRDKDDPLIASLQEHAGKVVLFEEDTNYIQLNAILDACSILIDGVFGTGIKLPLKGETANILTYVKNYLDKRPNKMIVVAVDCPSGIDCETGEAATETIPAEMTVTMAGVKSGMIMLPAAKYTGKLRVASIGPIDSFESFISNNKYILTADYVKNSLPDRALDAHKGTFGTAMIIAGSVNYTGAAFLSGMAAYRIGTGLVTMAIPSPLHAALAGQMPEATWILLPNEIGVISADAARVVRQNLDRATAILIGPGFGLNDTTREFLHKLLADKGSGGQIDIGFVHGTESGTREIILKVPVVLDADGLKLVSKINNWHKLLSSHSILTPHPGEMSVLTGVSTDEIQKNRLEIATKYAKKWGHVVVLKGAYTVIAEPEGKLAVVPIATPALARAGTGDVLAGIIVGLRAQGLDAFDAACAGAWIHATAGLQAAKRLGNTASVIASDVLNAIPEVLNSLE